MDPGEKNILLISHIKLELMKQFKDLDKNDQFFHSNRQKCLGLTNEKTIN